MPDNDRRMQTPAGVGATAFTVARARAVESRRADRLFDDPFAQRFLDAAGVATAAAGEASPGQTIDIRPFHDAYIPIRTRFFDDFLVNASGSGCPQVVILAAGLDARAFRLAWPEGVHVFELDLPEVLAFKERVLADSGAVPACGRAVVPVDLRGDWPAALVAAGFESRQPTAWLLEGLLMYLSEAERDRLLERIGAFSAPASRLALEPPVWTVPASLLASIAQGAVPASALGELQQTVQAAQSDPSIADRVAWLAGHGWKAQVVNHPELFARYGRAVQPALAEFFATLPRPLVSAERMA
jgi:methyltransferase (TIGR00027 family)